MARTFVSYFFISILLFIFIATVSCSWGYKSDRVRLKDIETLTLYHGRYTTSRRGSPVPQVKCVGGTAGCDVFTPRVVQCYNRGWDGYTTQWECKCDMDNDYRFGSVEVTCEGYDGPGDSDVLQGSCGLEYTLDLTKHGHENKHSSYNTHYNSYGSHGSQYYSSPSKKGWGSSFADLIIIAVIGVFGYALYKTCISSHGGQYASTGTADDATDGHGGPGGSGGYGWRYPSAPPPPGGEYYSGSGGGGCGNVPRYRGGGGGGGFWTGLGAGGLLGYMMGNRNNYGYRNANTYHRTPTASYGSSFSSGGSSGSSGSRSASGYGGTRVR